MKKPAESNITEQVLQAGTVRSSDHKDVVEEIPDRSVEERNFQEGAVASGVEQRTLPEEIPVTGYVQWYDQRQTLPVDIDKRFSPHQTQMIGVRHRVFQEAEFVSRTTPMLFPRETFSYVTQQSFYGEASGQRSVQENYPVPGLLRSHLSGKTFVNHCLI